VGLNIWILAGSKLFQSTTRPFDGVIRIHFLNCRDRHMASNMHSPGLDPIHDEEVEFFRYALFSKTLEQPKRPLLNHDR
jgi:hypothetical protein